MTAEMSTQDECADRVCVVTGAGRGLGREYALRLAAQGAAVVVNDIGTGLDGAGRSGAPGAAVVEEITAAGGRAVLNTDDVADFAGAQALVGQAVAEFGRLDVLVNNAGILRDRTIARMTEDEWDSVIRVHLKGTFATAHWALRHWRERAGAGPVHGRLINTTSVSGLFGNPGQANYGAAKAGIAAFTTIASLEAERYGVTVNAVSPGAATRMTDSIPGRASTVDDSRSPRWVAAVVCWLASRRSDGVTGRVFLSSGKRLAVAEGWHPGPVATPVDDPAEVDSVLRALVGKARAEADLTGADRVR
ncbi:SDR family NAD(P)-dependent oxidoreductase [Actinophytocola oryzae]|uniref:NAD(P)-dependent dehydrogenase (Short-subunit alcohol dehydrogenase family) n=1 Tax=Actinophytocola oryzae TaxID=502181 RepID=A0A4R7W1R5_9PSEU|nr:SDR family NAD(P)-dependent oxidoreductase [Actinophytocola oryzae]TDV56520.1 NAD(P)-dependent dehydrogenase (short-subunit alcohol dehydrogenase family) [Actinophytocola oryzae]